MNELDLFFIVMLLIMVFFTILILIAKFCETIYKRTFPDPVSFSRLKENDEQTSTV